MNIAATPHFLADVKIVNGGKTYIASGWALKFDDGTYFAALGRITPHLFETKAIATRASADGLIPEGLTRVQYPSL